LAVSVNHCDSERRISVTEAPFIPGLEGVVAFHTAIAEPDREGGSLRYRGVDVGELVGQVSFEDVWSLLVDDAFGARLPVETADPGGPNGRRSRRRPGVAAQAGGYPRLPAAPRHQ
jgi:Citrate synthase, C-terminal domain